MKKTVKVLAVILMAMMTMFAFTACGGEKSIEDVNKAMEKSGYTITTSKVGGIGMTIATKTADGVVDSVYYILCSDKESAETTQKLLNVGTALSGQTVSIKGKYVYYGTADAVKALEKAL